MVGARVSKVDIGSRLPADSGVTMNDLVTCTQRMAVLDGITLRIAAPGRKGASAAASPRRQAQQLGVALSGFRLAMASRGLDPKLRCPTHSSNEAPISNAS